MENHFFKLSPGDDIFHYIYKLSNELNSISFILSAVGDLSQCTFKCPHSDKPKVIKKKLEIISLNGNFKKEEVHLHISVADESCNVIGGHLLPGTIIHKGLDLLIGATSEIVEKGTNLTKNSLNNIDIYILPDCPWSERAMSLLDSFNINYRPHLISNDYDFNTINKITTYNTFPQIFIEGNFIGGFTELNELLNNN